MSDRRTAILTELATLEAQRASLLAELIALNMNPSPDDELLTVDATARILKTSTDWLYRHADTLPFTVRPGPGQVRFSNLGIQDYLRKCRR